jgi:tetratricopeptide (TPR) repeat protein
MIKDTRSKKAVLAIDLRDIKEHIQKTDPSSATAEDKRIFLKKILDLPDNYSDPIEIKKDNEKIYLYWSFPEINQQAEENHQKAILLARKNDLKLAVQFWNAATKLSPGNPDYFFNLGVAYFEQKKYIESIDALTRTLAICPIYHRAHLILGTAYLKLRKFENSRKHFEKAIAFDKSNVLAFLNLGTVYSILKDYQNGILMFEKAIALAPKEATAYMGLAKIYSTLSNTEKANYYFKKVIEYDKKGVLANYAHRLIVSQQISEKDEDKSIAMPTGNLDEYYAEAYRNYIVGNFQKSILIYQKYLRLKSNDDYVWYALGEAQLRAGKIEEAADSFKKAIKLSPSKGIYYKELAIAFDKLKQYDKVIAALTKAKDLGKNDSVTCCLWGKALFKLNSIGGAIEKFEESLKLNRNNLLTKYYLSLALKQNNEIDDAIYYLDEIIKSPINTPLKKMASKIKEEYQ